MRCKICHYDLANLTPTESGEHRCPECGNVFDPNDPVVESRWPHVRTIAFRITSSYVVMMLLYAFVWFPVIRWAPEGNELGRFENFGFVILIAVTASNVVTANQGWFARLALLGVVWLIGLVFLPAIGHA